MTETTKKALYTFGRTLVLAALPVAYDAVANGKGARDVALAVAIALFAGIEKWFAENPDYPGFTGLLFPH